MLTQVEIVMWSQARDGDVREAAETALVLWSWLEATANDSGGYHLPQAALCWLDRKGEADDE